jgi:hypothetical protein
VEQVQTWNVDYSNRVTAGNVKKKKKKKKKKAEEVVC